MRLHLLLTPVPTRILITPFLILPGTRLVHIREDLVRVDDDEVRRPDSSVWEITAKAGLEGREDVVVHGVDGGGALGSRGRRGGDELEEVAWGGLALVRRHPSLRLDLCCGCKAEVYERVASPLAFQ